MTARPNPPWSNDILTSHWAQLLEAVGPAWMPRHSKARTRITAEEFGTGHYGVVMPTMTPGIVMKLTSDADEARFLTWLTSHKKFAEDHPGLIPYYRIVQVFGTSRMNRDVFAVWRAEADKVGKAFEASARYMHDRSYEVLTSMEASRRISDFKMLAHSIKIPVDRAKNQAQFVQKTLSSMDEFRGEVDIDDLHKIAMGQDAGMTGARLAGFRLEAARVTAEMMANEPGATEVGQALLDLLEDHGILLADVHAGNIGMYTPPDYSSPIRVITDPGHAVFLKPEARVNPIGKWW